MLCLTLKELFNVPFVALRKEYLSFLKKLGVNDDVVRRFMQWCQDAEYHYHRDNVIASILEANFASLDGSSLSDEEHLLLTGFLPSSPIFVFLSQQSDQHLSLRNKLDRFITLFCSPDRPTSTGEFPFRDDCRNEGFQFGGLTPVGAANFKEGNQSMLFN